MEGHEALEGHDARQRLQPLASRDLARPLAAEGRPTPANGPRSRHTEEGQRAAERAGAGPAEGEEQQSEGQEGLSEGQEGPCRP